MRFCKTCGTLYGSSLPCCPKCNPVLKEAAKLQESAPEADKSVVRRQWLALIIGIPAFIGAIWLIIRVYSSIVS